MDRPERSPKSGYFKVSLEAARQIVAASEGPETLAGYIVLREGAYGTDRKLTACGANAIAKYVGCTGWRGKRVMDELRSLCFGDRCESWLIRDNETKLRNARVYTFAEWTGTHAYLPALLIKSRSELPAPLYQICSSDDDAELKRDALLLLLHLYALTDYAGWMGAPPDCFVHQRWETEGTRAAGDDDFDLGRCAEVNGLGLWMVAPPIDDAWMLPHRLHGDLFTEGINAAKGRIWRALWFLLRSGSVCKVAAVTDGSRNYPLWVFSKSYRTSLADHHGIRADVADAIYRLAGDVGADPDYRLIIAATGADREPSGTGIYFCAAKAKPIVRTLLIPRLHAPTPQNMDALREAAKVSTAWASTIAKLRRQSNAA